MYRGTILHDTPRFFVTSWGNGLAYIMTHRHAHRSIFFQGEDVEEFRQLLTTYEETCPNVAYDELLFAVWSNFAELATPEN